MTVRGCWILFFGVLALAGCGPDDEAYRRTSAERSRLDGRGTELLAAIPRAAAVHDFAGALALSDSLARRAPELADVPYERGRIFAQMGHLDEAEAAFERTLDLDPNYPGAWFELGNLAFRQRRYEAALGRFEKEEALLLTLGEVQPEGVSWSPRGLPATRLQMGRAAKQLGEPVRAAELFERTLRADSTYAEAYYELSRLKEEEGDFEAALALARQAHRYDAESPDHLYLLGSLLSRTGQPEEAVPYLEAAVARRPWYSSGLYNLGQALVRAGRAEEAEPYLQRAEHLRRLQAEIDQVRLDAEQYPRVAGHWLKLAGLYASSGRYEEAEQVLGTALRLEPENPRIRNDLGNLYALRGDYASAARVFQGILAQDPSQADAWMNLGVVYALSGRLEEAEQAWQRTLEHDPGHAEAKANLARLSEMQP